MSSLKQRLSNTDIHQVWRPGAGGCEGEREREREGEGRYTSTPFEFEFGGAVLGNNAS